MIGAYDPTNGKEIWRATYDGYSVYPARRLSTVVFFSTGFDRAKAMAVQLGGKGDVTETHGKWILPKGAPHTPTWCSLATSCTWYPTAVLPVVWMPRAVRRSGRLGGGCSTSPILANGKLYQVNEAGTVYVLENKQGVQSPPKLRRTPLASPAVAHGALYIRTAIYGGLSRRRT